MFKLLLIKYFKLFINQIMVLLWPKYMMKGNPHNEVVVLKCFLMQKILRINSQIEWPVHPTSKIIAPEMIERGSRTPGLARGCHIDGRNGIVFGKNVWVGPHVKIISMNHDPCCYNKYIKAASIRIGDNCWIGAGAVILPSVTLGNHTIIGAGSVVAKSFPKSDQIVAGNPAQIIRKISQYHDGNR